MLSITDSKDIIQNVYRMSSVPGVTPRTLGDLRDAYLGLLQGPRFEAPVNTSATLVITSPEAIGALSAAFSGGALNDLDQSTIIGDVFDERSMEIKRKAVDQAVAELRSLSPDLDRVFSLVIHSVMIKGTNKLSDGSAAHGGSSSNAIGTIWLSVDDSLRHPDIVELLLHELTHHLVFIDEYNRNHFDYDLIAMPDNYALSAIRGTFRPLDKVVHSIIVATELVYARSNLFRHNESEVAVHPDTATILRETLASCESVMGLPNVDELASKRAQELVEVCQQKCKIWVAERESVSA